MCSGVYLLALGLITVDADGLAGTFLAVEPKLDSTSTSLALSLSS